MALPTRKEMFQNTLASLSEMALNGEEALAWLRSDWRPVGSELTTVQGRARDQMRATVRRALAEIEEAKRHGETAVRS